MESYFAYRLGSHNATLAPQVRKVTIVGPESSGKTTLCKALAEHYDAPWVEECARGYLENQGGRYEERDLELIASAQHDIEILEMNRAWEAHKERYRVLRPEFDPFEEQERVLEPVKYPELPLLLCDTDMITVRIWSVEKYGRCDPRIIKLCEEWPYDYWLLCRPDIPWEPDPLRENPNDRDRLFAAYEAMLKALGKPHTIIEGDHAQRMRKATALIDVLIDSDPVQERWD